MRYKKRVKKHKEFTGTMVEVRNNNIEFAKSSTEERRGPSLFPCPGKSIERTPLFFLRKCLVGKVQTV